MRLFDVFSALNTKIKYLINCCGSCNTRCEIFYYFFLVYPRPVNVPTLYSNREHPDIYNKTRNHYNVLVHMQRVDG